MKATMAGSNPETAPMEATITAVVGSLICLSEELSTCVAR
jgi:hypothetical protein